MFDLDAYLGRIGLRAAHSLAEVHRAHVAAIPFENLELLCPNCHSQTDTFSGRNGHGKGGDAVA